MGIPVNFEDVILFKENAIPEGEYEVKCNGVEVFKKYRVVKSITVPMLRWTFRIASGAYEGEKLFLETSTTINSSYFFPLEKLLSALGYSENEIESFMFEGDDCEIKSNSLFTVMVEQSSKWYSNIKFVRSGGI